MGKFDKDSLGDRMKDYEAVYKQKAMPKMPIVIRIDGKAFHTFTKGMHKPFDDLLMDAMQRTMISLCSELQGAVFGYVQSDEITIVSKLADIRKSEMLYDGKVQKILSITPSKATKYFNKYFFENVEKLERNPEAFKNHVDISVYKKKLFEAEFDTRMMSIPDFDVINNLIWRQQDAVRNSISAMAHSMFTTKELHGKNCSDMMDMMIERGQNWNDLPTYKKRGTCCYKVEEGIRSKWKLDLDMPILTEDRNFFESKFNPESLDEKLENMPKTETNNEENIKKEER